MDDSEFDDSEPSPLGEQAGEGRFSTLPVLAYYQKMYAASLGDNDQKAVKLFRDYEPHEKLRRLQFELNAVKNKQATTKACDISIGKKRLSKYQSYSRWAANMLIWFSEYKK